MAEPHELSSDDDQEEIGPLSPDEASESDGSTENASVEDSPGPNGWGRYPHFHKRSSHSPHPDIAI